MSTTTTERLTTTTTAYPPPPVRVRDACQILDCSVPTIYKMLATGRLTETRIGASCRVTHASLMDVLEGRS